MSLLDYFSCRFFIKCFLIFSCDLINGSYVPEGTFVEMRGDEVHRTADIVFIVEAKSCNKNLTESKSMGTVVAALNKELIDANITDNRYAVISFGGESPFDVPRSVVFNNKVFSTDYRNLNDYFNHIKTGESKNNDIFHAIITASKLIFRPGASKTFILLPCSNCVATDMKVCIFFFFIDLLFFIKKIFFGILVGFFITPSITP